MVRFSTNAKKFLRKRGIATIVLRFVEFEAGGTLGVAKDVAVTFDAPDDAKAFRRDLVEGVEVFIDPKLKVDDDVVIKRQGFWHFSSLYADGVRVPI